MHKCTAFTQQHLLYKVHRNHLEGWSLLKWWVCLISWNGTWARNLVIPTISQNCNLPVKNLLFLAIIQILSVSNAVLMHVSSFRKLETICSKSFWTYCCVIFFWNSLLQYLGVFKTQDGKIMKWCYSFSK